MDDRIGRREILSAAGATTAVTIAGCLEDTTAPDEGDSDSDATTHDLSEPAYGAGIYGRDLYQ